MGGDQERITRNVLKRYATLWGLLLVGVASLLFHWRATRAKIDELALEEAALAQEWESLREWSRKQETFERDQARGQELAEKAQSLLETTPAFQLLADLDSLPGEVLILQIEEAPVKPGPVARTGARGKILIQGQAVSAQAPEVLRELLGQTGRYAGIDLVEVQPQNQQGGWTHTFIMSVQLRHQD